MMSERPNSGPIADSVTRLWYTAFPTNYTDEDSSIEQLLWQLVLETRSLRVVLLACALVAPLMLSLGIVAGVMLLD
jgi:hypothetical protein